MKSFSLRWKEELELESGRWQEKLHQLEGEKTDAVLAIKRKFDSLEVSKANEISRLQSLHRWVEGWGVE